MRSLYPLFVIVVVGCSSTTTVTTETVQPDGTVTTETAKVDKNAESARVLAIAVQECVEALPRPGPPPKPPTYAGLDITKLAPEAQVAAMMAQAQAATTLSYQAIIIAIAGKDSAGPCTSIMTTWGHAYAARQDKVRALATLGLSLGIPAFFGYLNNHDDSKVLRSAFANSGGNVNLYSGAGGPGGGASGNNAEGNAGGRRRR